jgi:hypothetical protein
MDQWLFCKFAKMSNHEYNIILEHFLHFRMIPFSYLHLISVFYPQLANHWAISVFLDLLIYVHSCNIISFINFYCWITFHYKAKITYFIYSPVDGHLGCFCLLVFMEINLCTCLYVNSCFFFFSWVITWKWNF